MIRFIGLTCVAVTLSIAGCKPSGSEPSGDAQSYAENQIAVDITPAYPPRDELMSRLAQMGPAQKSEALQDAKMLVSAYGIKPAQELSNSLWAGNDGYSRNRPVSAVLAIAAYEQEPQLWSALRAGIAYVNGLGVAKDGEKAVNILSNELLAENSGGQYFLSKAYTMTGNEEMAQKHLQIAADMGHGLAKKELSK